MSYVSLDKEEERDLAV